MRQKDLRITNRNHCRRRYAQFTSGAGGAITAESLRQNGFTGRIVVISRESYLPIDRPKLSKALKVEASKIALRTFQEYEEMNIEFLLGTVSLFYAASNKRQYSGQIRFALLWKIHELQLSGHCNWRRCNSFLLSPEPFHALDMNFKIFSPCEMWKMLTCLKSVL
jgi:hypothetical protein